MSFLLDALKGKSSDSAVSASNVDQAGSASHPVLGYKGQVLQAVDEECCPGVVDPLELLATLGGIAGATLAFRQLVITQIMMVRRKRGMPLSLEGDALAERAGFIDRLDDMFMAGKVREKERTLTPFFLSYTART